MEIVTFFEYRNVEIVTYFEYFNIEILTFFEDYNMEKWQFLEIVMFLGVYSMIKTPKKVDCRSKGLGSIFLTNLTHYPCSGSKYLWYPNFFSCDNSSRSALVTSFVRPFVRPFIRNLLWFLDLKKAQEGHFCIRKGIWSSFYINTILLPLWNLCVKLPLGN